MAMLVYQRVKPWENSWKNEYKMNSYAPSPDQIPCYIPFIEAPLWGTSYVLTDLGELVTT